LSAGYELEITVVKQTGFCDEGINEGAKWYIGEDFKCPAGMCGAAWASMYYKLWAMRFGAVHPWMEKQGKPDLVNAVCPDVACPRVFEIRRVKEKYHG